MGRDFVREKWAIRVKVDYHIEQMGDGEKQAIFMVKTKLFKDGAWKVVGAIELVF